MKRNTGQRQITKSPNHQMQDLGRMAYAQAYDVQCATHERVVAGEIEGALLLVEHDPVITVGRRANAAKHIVASADRLKQLGIDVIETNRGGDVTYHGPGQIVAYPIVSLKKLNMGVATYMRWLEQWVMDVLGVFDIEGQRDHCATGVWVGDAKICALGVRVRRNVTLHGIALNVTTDLSHFETIIPCGLAGRPVTSMQRLLGDATPSIDHVKRVVIEQFEQRL